MTSNKTSVEPPSYSASVYLNPSLDQSDFLARLAENRTLHLCETIESFIAPVVNSRLNRALSSTNIALIPTPASSSHVSSTDHDFKTAPSEIVGLASDHDLDAQIQLIDETDKLEFWKQTGVIPELEHLIEQRWKPSLPCGKLGNAFEELVDATRAPEPARHIQSTREQRSTSFFSRLSSGQSKLEMTNAQPLRSLDVPKRVPVRVRLDEICFRTISLFGLYETVVKPAIIISIDMLG